MAVAASIKKLIVIAGPTAVGKTQVTLALARKLDCPILSADSRQCYKELGVATAKPCASELRAVKHYFINSHSIHQPFTAADYEHYALNKLQEIFKTVDQCLLTGGSGLYINAVCQGLDEIPTIPQDLRLQLEQRWQQEGLAGLNRQLLELDPRSAAEIDPANPRRVLRALEVCLSTGRAFSEFRRGKAKSRPFDIIKIGLHRDRQDLYDRIERRMEEMIEEGLFEEAEKLAPYRDLRPLQTVGYQEVFDYLDGKYSRTEAIRLLKRNSRRYAKRQLTWFRKDKKYQWFHAKDLQAISDFLELSLKN